MDSQTAVVTFKLNSTQPPTFNVIETPIHYEPFAAPSIDLSFSSYLKNDPMQNSPKDPQPALDDSEINVFDAQKYFSESNDSKETKIEMGSSNLRIRPNDSVSMCSSVLSSVDRYGINFRARSFHSTPTASSEASWNSQTGLLSKTPAGNSAPVRNVGAIQKISGPSAGKRFFCRKCPCTGKKALQVIEKEGSAARINGEPNFQRKNQSHTANVRMVQLQKLPNLSLRSSGADELSERYQKATPVASRIQSENHFILSSDALRLHPSSSTPRPVRDSAAGGFSFPLLKNSSYTNPNLELKKLALIRTSGKTSFEETPRKSLDIFQPRNSLSNPRKTVEDDVASDASSDLFEIESLCTQTNSHRKRDSLDEASTLHTGRFAANNFSIDHEEPITPRTECYAPSEASIEWSVTTAEGFDKASMTNFSMTGSEFEVSTISRLRSMEKYGVEAGGVGFSSSLQWNEGGFKKKTGNGFLGCRHEKAVSVGPNPVKFVPAGPPLPLISTPGHVSGGALRPPKTKFPQSSKGHSARLPLAFAA